MKVYFKKINFYLKEKKISRDELCREIGIGRTSLWNWEKNKSIPKEIYIRAIAEKLNVSISEISDLNPDYPVSNNNISQLAPQWIDLSNKDLNTEYQEIISIQKNINALNKKLHNASKIINALMSNTENTVIYIKNIHLEYIIANGCFLKNLSLPIDFITSGKTDFSFFPAIEAGLNTKQDEQVLKSGKPIHNIEGYIPGTRKKKWGIISKIPVFDIENKIEGVIGIIIDITVHKKNQQEKQVLYKVLSLFDKTVAWTAETDKDNQLKYSFISDSIKGFSGYDKEDFLIGGRKFISVVHPSHKILFENWLIRKQTPVEFEHLIVCQNSKIKWVMTNIKSETNNKGKTTFYGTHTDITETKILQQTLIAYQQESEHSKVKIIAQRLKNENIPNDIILKVTDLPEKELLEL